ncbi:hypothetical protein NECAME_14920 [Necator americanus]|uniref:Uncharacterized protein n=1 Tax=Necator americanus TaxID=51031 RepID=W2SKY8_NECAM|nr:hypothetical protein NECAME_14920 [Necator americanus]ETN70218.1 hypothetical protein NECAME_14920 [Necator americanus]
MDNIDEKNDRLVEHLHDCAEKAENSDPFWCRIVRQLVLALFVDEDAVLSPMRSSIPEARRRRFPY